MPNPKKVLESPKYQHERAVLENRAKEVYNKISNYERDISDLLRQANDADATQQNEISRRVRDLNRSIHSLQDDLDNRYIQFNREFTVPDLPRDMRTRRQEQTRAYENQIVRLTEEEKMLPVSSPENVKEIEELKQKIEELQIQQNDEDDEIERKFNKAVLKKPSQEYLNRHGLDLETYYMLGEDASEDESDDDSDDEDESDDENESDDDSDDDDGDEDDGGEDDEGEDTTPTPQVKNVLKHFLPETPAGEDTSSDDGWVMEEGGGAPTATKDEEEGGGAPAAQLSTQQNKDLVKTFKSQLDKWSEKYRESGDTEDLEMMDQMKRLIKKFSAAGDDDNDDAVPVQAGQRGPDLPVPSLKDFEEQIHNAKQQKKNLQEYVQVEDVPGQGKGLIAQKTLDPGFRIYYYGRYQHEDDETPLTEYVVADPNGSGLQVDGGDPRIIEENIAGRVNHAQGALAIADLKWDKSIQQPYVEINSVGAEGGDQITMDYGKRYDLDRFDGVTDTITESEEESFDEYEDEDEDLKDFIDDSGVNEGELAELEMKDETFVPNYKNLWDDSDQAMYIDENQRVDKNDIEAHLANEADRAKVKLYRKHYEENFLNKLFKSVPNPESEPSESEFSANRITWFHERNEKNKEERQGLKAKLDNLIQKMGDVEKGSKQEKQLQKKENKLKQRIAQKDYEGKERDFYLTKERKERNKQISEDISSRVDSSKRRINSLKTRLPEDDKKIEEAQIKHRKLVRRQDRLQTEVRISQLQEEIRDAEEAIQKLQTDKDRDNSLFISQYQTSIDAWKTELEELIQKTRTSGKQKRL